jgi:hypothetical protein
MRTKSGVTVGAGPLKLYIYQEFPKWVEGAEGPVIVQDANEERRTRWELARNVGRQRANATQRARADALACELAPEIIRLRARGRSYRDIACILDRLGIRPARGREWGAGQVWRLLYRARRVIPA